jgi:hypothetical protein
MATALGNALVAGSVPPNSDEATLSLIAEIRSRA